MKIIKLITYLNEDQALAMAQFLKRAKLHDFRGLAVSEQETYFMQEAAIKIAAALADNGFDPR